MDPAPPLRDSHVAPPDHDDAADGMFPRERRGPEGSDHLLRLAMDAAGLLLTETDAQTGVLHVFPQSTGWAALPAALSLEEAWAMVHRDDRAEVVARFEAALRSGGEVSSEHRVLLPDGTTRWVSVRGRSFTAEAPHHRMLWVTQDITVRKQQEAALRESEARFRVMADETPVPIWVTDSRGTIEFVNREYCRFFGVTLEQVIEDGWTPLVHPEDGAYIETFLECLRTRAAFRAETRARAADGEWRWLASYAAPWFSASGEFEGFVGSSPDITERKRAEQAQLEATRHKDDFIAVLAHELRNPLAPIRTAAGILRARASSDPLVLRCRDVIDRQASHMARLLEDLLDVSRLSQGKLVLQRSRVLLRHAVEAAVESSRASIEQQRHQLVLEGLDHPLVVDGDPARITQVVANLLENACKYTDPGGRISLSLAADRGHAVIAVRDTGIGIAPEMLRRVFEPFAQGERTYSRSRGGLGIGLALARRLVVMQGGTIDARSDGPGHGSEFRVRLPLAPADSAAVAAEAADIAEPGSVGRRVLVVEDNVDGAEMLAVLLADAGCDVHTVHDGEAAVDLARQYQPDVILLDIGLPTLDGHETCRRIRREPWSAGMTIVAVTGWGQCDDQRRSVLAGFDRHLVKPVDPAVLVQIIRQVQPRVV
jgi:PAS domain S-box-containing protein